MDRDAASEILEDYLEHFPHLRLRVSGSCMDPALAEGCTVYLENTQRRPPRWGDVVLVRQPAGLRLHRLVWAPPAGRWRTKGDRTPSVDGGVGPADILATVVSVDRSTVTVRNRTRAAQSLLAGILTRLRAVRPAA